MLYFFRAIRRIERGTLAFYGGQCYTMGHVGAPVERTALHVHKVAVSF